MYLFGDEGEALHRRADTFFGSVNRKIVKNNQRDLPNGAGIQSGILRTVPRKGGDFNSRHTSVYDRIVSSTGHECYINIEFRCISTTCLGCDPPILSSVQMLQHEDRNVMNFAQRKLALVSFER